MKAPAAAPPGPSGITGLVSFLRDAPGFLARVARRHGDVASVRIGPLGMVLVNHPDLVTQVMEAEREQFVKAGMSRAHALVGTGLLTSEGAFHDRQRALAEPAFAAAHVDGYLDGIHDVVDGVTADWQAGSEVDVATAMLDVTARTIIRAMFSGHPTHDLQDSSAAAAFESEVASDLSAELDWLNLYPEPLELLDRLPLPARARMRQARHRLTAHAKSGSLARRGRPANDLLGRLLASVDADGAGMSNVAAADEVKTMLIAAHERTAMALTWTLLLLAQHPAAQARVAQEVTELGPDHRPAAKDATRLHFTGAVVRESLRLYPPVWLIARKPLATVTLGGFYVPAGTWVLLSAYVTHRDGRFFDDPAAFRPERWLDEGGTLKSPPADGSFFPFGTGPRGCIGQRLARIECLLVVASLVSKWQLAPARRDLPGGLQPTVTLRPKRPIVLRLSPREKGSG